MSTFSPMRLGLALPAIFLTQAAWADLTPAQVWGDWKQYMQSMGYSVTANETANGSDLSVSDIAMSLTLPDGGGDMSMSMGTLNFVQNGGAVDIVMPDSMPITIDGGPDGRGEKLTLSFVYTQTGQSLTASGTPEEISYTYDAESIAMVLSQLQLGDQVFGTDVAKVNIQGTGVNSATTMSIGDMRTYTQSSSIESVSYDLSFDNPEEDMKINMVGALDRLSFGGGGSIPLDMAANAADMAAMMKAGFAVNGEFSYRSGNTQIALEEPTGEAFTSTSSSQDGSIGVVMNASKIAYLVDQKDVQVNFQSAQIPFPVQMSMARSAFTLDLPIEKSDTPQDFALGITLGDFVMSDMIWSIFDPSSQLPRDPATIDLDLAGKATVLVDVMDPASAASVDVPGKLEALTLRKLLINVAGAKLEGSGDFTFDNNDMSTFPGMPKPVGAVDVALAGGNTLMDKLVAMGLLPEEQAMGARMMMGLFAVPGDAPDTLKSKVEFTQDGQVLANGQRIK